VKVIKFMKSTLFKNALYAGLILIILGLILLIFSIKLNDSLFSSILNNLASVLFISALVAVINDVFLKHSLMEMIIEKLNVNNQVVEVGLKNIELGLEGFNSTDRIRNSQENIDIVHAYAASWTGNNFSALVDTLRNTNCNIRVVLLDPKAAIVPGLANHFRISESELINRIENVTQEWKKIYSESGIGDDRLKLYYHNGMQTNALYRIDNEIILIQLKLAHAKRTKLPYIICENTRKREDLFSVYLEEIEDLICESREIKLSDIK
jgi:hypothetical protein